MFWKGGVVKVTGQVLPEFTTLDSWFLTTRGALPWAQTSNLLLSSFAEQRKPKLQSSHTMEAKLHVKVSEGEGACGSHLSPLRGSPLSHHETGHSHGGEVLCL